MQQTTDPRPLHVLYGLLLEQGNASSFINSISYYADIILVLDVINEREKFELMAHYTSRLNKKTFPKNGEQRAAFIRKMIEITKPKTE